MTMDPEIRARQEHIDLRKSILEIPPYIERRGLYVEFPTNPETGVTALTCLKLETDSKVSLIYPSFSFGGDPVVVTLESLRGTEEIQQHDVPAHPDQGRLTYMYGTLKNKRHLYVSHSKEHPWNIEAKGKTLANVYFNRTERSLSVLLTNFRLPVAVHVLPRHACTFLVAYRHQLHPLHVLDLSQLKNGVGWPDPRARVQFHTGWYVRFDPSRPTESWMVDGSPLCTFSFLTPRAGMMNLKEAAGNQ